MRGLARSPIPTIGIAPCQTYATVTLPFRPMHTRALGLSIETFALCSWVAAVRWELTSGRGLDGSHYLFTLTVVFLCTGLTGVLYAERRAEHQAHQDALEAAEALAGARTRLLLAESTASLGRLAAGLLHELNSPIGALLLHELNSPIGALASAAGQPR